VRDEVLFIFIGGFIAGRGLEDLITAWSRVDKRARLLLQGPDGSFKTEMMELARSLGLFGDRILFPQAVETTELVSAARQADVGIIPYAASSINNRYCSPNKLSQYMAAGLPIVCNHDLEFVRSIVVENGLGIKIMKSLRVPLINWLRQRMTLSNSRANPASFLTLISTGKR
jgi:glycosyltransferase involved in cell wall biosynthesis